MKTQKHLSRRYVILIVLGVCVLCVPVLLAILIFLIKFSWPRIKDHFDAPLEDLEAGSRVD